MIYVEKYNKDGYIFSLVNKQKNIAIFSQALEEDNKIIAYEVYVLKTKDNNLTIPTTNSWGKLGFTFRTIEKAKSKMEELLKNQK